MQENGWDEAWAEAERDLRHLSISSSARQERLAPMAGPTTNTDAFGQLPLPADNDRGAWNNNNSSSTQHLHEKSNAPQVSTTARGHSTQFPHVHEWPRQAGSISERLVIPTLAASASGSQFVTAASGSQFAPAAALHGHAPQSKNIVVPTDVPVVYSGSTRDNSIKHNSSDSGNTQILQQQQQQQQWQQQPQQQQQLQDHPMQIRQSHVSTTVPDANTATAQRRRLPATMQPGTVQRRPDGTVRIAMPKSAQRAAGAAALLRAAPKPPPLRPLESLARPIWLTAETASQLLRLMAAAEVYAPLAQTNKGNSANGGRPNSTAARQARDAALVVQAGTRAANIVSRLLGWTNVRGLALVEGASLRRHQLRGLCFMRERESPETVAASHGIDGGIMCMDMGMGKSLTAGAHIMLMPRGVGPSLIVCSKTLLFEWRSQMVERFFGRGSVRPLRVLYFHPEAMSGGHAQFNAMTPQRMGTAYDIVVTTYDVCRNTAAKWQVREMVRDVQRGTKRVVVRRARQPLLDGQDMRVHGAACLYAVMFERIVCDESQTFANPETSTYAAMMGLAAVHSWCLTGTPVRNYSTDVWAQLRFVGYTGIETPQQWRDQGERTYALHGLPRAVLAMGFADCQHAGSTVTASPASAAGHTNSMPEGSDSLEALEEESHREAAFMKLPPRTDRLLQVIADPEQVQVHRRLLQLAATTLSKFAAGSVSYGRVLMVLTRLRQAADAPHLMMMSRGQRDQIAMALAAHMDDPEEDIGVLLAEAAHLGRSRNQNQAAATAAAEAAQQAMDDVQEDNGNDDADDAEAQSAQGDGELDEERLVACAPPPAIFYSAPQLQAWCADRDGTAGVDSPKTRTLCSLLAAMPVDEKAIVFSNFRSALLLAALAIAQKRPLASPDYGDKAIQRQGGTRGGRNTNAQQRGRGTRRRAYAILIDGTITGQQRASLLDQFRSDPYARVLLMTYRVGAEGINLTAANHVFFLEPGWNDSSHAQAAARSYRIGQARPVSVVMLASRSTVDAGILRLCADKRAMAQSYVQMSRDVLNTSRGAVVKKPLAAPIGRRDHNALSFDSLWQLITKYSAPENTTDITVPPPQHSIAVGEAITTIATTTEEMAPATSGIMPSAPHSHPQQTDLPSADTATMRTARAAGTTRPRADGTVRIRLDSQRATQNSNTRSNWQRTRQRRDPRGALIVRKIDA